MSEEPLPVSESISVLESKTIYKTQKWWCAVALVNAFGYKKVTVYLWLKGKNGKWKRKQNLTINRNTWNELLKIIPEFLEKV